MTLAITTKQRWWLAVFGLSLAVLITTALWSNFRLASYRDQPFDFRTMKPGEMFVTLGLTRRQQGSVKLGFAETHEPPEIGLFGNHIFAFFDSTAFGRSNDASYFFNYWFANLALPELYRYLRHLEHLGHLPKKLILVQITSPNLDNGMVVIDFGYELPPDLLFVDANTKGLPEQTRRLAAFAWQATENRLHEVLNYGPFILGFVRQEFDNRVVDPTSCQGHERTSRPSLLRRVLASAQVLNVPGQNQYCERRFWQGAFQPDGSIEEEYSEFTLIRNEQALTDADRGLHAGDEYEIARLMRDIDAIGRRHNIKVAFIVPPVYETNRSDSVVNQVFNRGLALVPDLKIIDHRDMTNDPALFNDYRHPSAKYFSLLVDDLRRRRLID